MYNNTLVLCMLRLLMSQFSVVSTSSGAIFLSLFLLLKRSLHLTSHAFIKYIISESVHS